mmetsp:Transcript_49973/g.159924  ORF Transcript_49973/g.159924 Transcript_49973/m.159924 type:complete len:241 (-) Transcript_49973:975-1697(-)
MMGTVSVSKMVAMGTDTADRAAPMAPSTLSSRERWAARTPPPALYSVSINIGAMKVPGSTAAASGTMDESLVLNWWAAIRAAVVMRIQSSLWAWGKSRDTLYAHARVGGSKTDPSGHESPSGGASVKPPRNVNGFWTTTEPCSSPSLGGKKRPTSAHCTTGEAPTTSGETRVLLKELTWYSEPRRSPEASRATRPVTPWNTRARSDAVTFAPPWGPASAIASASATTQSYTYPAIDGTID